MILLIKDQIQHNNLLKSARPITFTTNVMLGTEMGALYVYFLTENSNFYAFFYFHSVSAVSASPSISFQQEELFHPRMVA
jgi:hypothetical protein